MIQIPKAVLVSLSDDNIIKANVLAKKFAKFDKWGSTKWGHGLLNEGTKKNLAEYIGICGELAFSEFSDLPMDEEFKAEGNDYDFKIPNSQYKIDVKTHAKDYGWHFIKAANRDGGYIPPLKSDIYVFATIAKNESNEVDVELNGWITKSAIEKNGSDRIGPAMRGNHVNYYIQKDELNCMSLLTQLLNEYRKLEQVQ